MSLPAAPFGRVLTAMVTPFDAEGGVDLDAAVAVAGYLADHGHDGVVISGTTGESPTTSVAEDGELLRAVSSAVGDRLQVVAGVGTNSTAHSLELTEQATKLGAAGVMVVTPYYSKPSQLGVLAHFDAVAAATDLPVMLYDVPGRTGTRVSWETYARAAERSNVVAVKEAVGDFAQGVRLVRDLGLALYSGDDVANLAWLAHGAAGVISVVGHASGDAHAAMVAAVDAGDLVRAQEIYHSLLPAIDAVMGAPNYGATTAKAALQLLGVLDNRRVRLPLLELDDVELDTLRAGLAAAHLI
ncbi:dihydrodipicolinate synthase [Nocardioides scoriae]|uniref:4-hydroxy-tetrahydrodipicolinate synthase n=1 Tax=Nocardioides scoriae TaxID=642780 RepID=A0A1H1L543_9ACTN|nr:4-hydroxy-tetrahydrodipicolinate synthase [Nocardioides scoriae]SDR69450.1 dihydrodipicolinate synthase [Nocardioides scoriae]